MTLMRDVNISIPVIMIDPNPEIPRLGLFLD